MNKVLLQLWEESSENSFIADGCSIHLTINDHEEYMNQKNSNRSDIIPGKFENKVSEFLYVFIEDSMFEMLKNVKNIRLSQNEMRNLINIEEIIILN